MILSKKREKVFLFDYEWYLFYVILDPLVLNEEPV